MPADSSDDLTASPIGVFDSGMGGLTVLAELVRALPGESFVYLGDTARVPYGSRSARTVQRYSLEVADFLLARGIKLLVIACNTATAHAEALLKERMPVPVLGVIQPGVRAGLQRTRNKRLGVIGTRATIRSGSYEQALRELAPEAQVFSRACPLFVPLVEEGWLDKRITALTVEEYLAELVREEIDSVILGCTHYPLLKTTINEVFPNLELIDSSIEIARAVKEELTARKLLRDPGAARNDGGESTAPGGVQIFLTDVTDQMQRLEQLFYGMRFDSVEEIELGD